MSSGDTIFALSTGSAPAGVAVIRISGEAAGKAAQMLCHREHLPPRQVFLTTLGDPESNDILDKGLVLWFPGPQSFTGEDCAELHCHGGAATISALLDALGKIPGCRHAEAGEFSRRAFRNDKLDLTEIEGLSDLISAETEAQRRLALKHASGHGKTRYREWTDRLVKLLAYLEAAVDFPEEDLPETLFSECRARIDQLLLEWQEDLAGAARSSRIREGIRIAILGPPNVGKSTLLNCLARRDVAIVSAREGTTRDILETRLDLGGYLATLVDTAGLRSSEDEIEEEGIRRALKEAEQSDIRLLLSDRAELVDQLLDDQSLSGSGVSIGVLTKIDAAPAPPGWENTQDRFAVSATSGEGIYLLLEALTRHCAALANVVEGSVTIRNRHRDCLHRAALALEQAKDAPEIALMGEDVRVALTELGRITGRVDVEAILDIIFSEFCIGK